MTKIKAILLSMLLVELINSREGGALKACLGIIELLTRRNSGRLYHAI